MLENHQFHQHLGCWFSTRGFFVVLGVVLKKRECVHVSGMCFFGYAWDFFFFGWVGILGGKMFFVLSSFVEKIFLYTNVL